MAINPVLKFYKHPICPLSNDGKIHLNFGQRNGFSPKNVGTCTIRVIAVARIELGLLSFHCFI
jgi:hypothetical protein